jgi:hypothetical protein
MLLLEEQLCPLPRHLSASTQQQALQAWQQQQVQQATATACVHQLPKQQPLMPVLAKLQPAVTPQESNAACRAFWMRHKPNTCRYQQNWCMTHTMEKCTQGSSSSSSSR